MQRRHALQSIGGLFVLPNLLVPAPAVERKRVLRVAHITDVHLKNELGAPSRFTQCLHHIQEQNPKVDFVLNGGDVVFDMNKESKSSIETLWKLEKGLYKSECSLPAHYCLGNHDIWWNEDDKNQAIYGKRYSLDQLQMASPYYSMIKDGWKFIMLDSCHLDIDGTWYIGKLGDEQFSWLQNELNSTEASMPVLILSHIPILTATNLIVDDTINRWEMTGGDMHTDNAKIIELFYRHPNVKLCLSGHIHLREKLEYNNVTYICNGAVSGAWWNGNRRETPAGYALIDLYNDGSFEERYLTYDGGRNGEGQNK